MSRPPRISWTRSRTILLPTAVLVVALGAMGATNYLSRVVERNLQDVQPAVGLTVEGVPQSAAAGDIFGVMATVRNNAGRPVPAVLRFELRGDYTVGPDDATVLGPCGAEEQTSTKALTYYLGDHGPLLAPNGTSFPAGTSAATVQGVLGPSGHWDAVLREIGARDPRGYASLISPAPNATEGIRATQSGALKALYYYGLVTSGDPTNPDPHSWTLTSPFQDSYRVGGGVGFSVEMGLAVRGAFTLRFWAERPDGLGVPNHPWRCGPL